MPPKMRSGGTIKSTVTGLRACAAVAFQRLLFHLSSRVRAPGIFAAANVRNRMMQVGHKHYITGCQARPCADLHLDVPETFCRSTDLGNSKRSRQPRLSQ